MNRPFIRSLAIVSSLFCLFQTVRAQTASAGADLESNFPVLPMTIRFRVVPQYFTQLLADDHKYSRIEALADSGAEWYEVILTDKTTGRRVVYSNSDGTVNDLNRRGRDAYKTPIGFVALQRTNSAPAYEIKFRDSSGQPVDWNFIVNPSPAQTQPSELPAPDSLGNFIWMMASAPRAAAPGTGVRIGDQTTHAGRADGRASLLYEAFYAADLTIAEIPYGTQLWDIHSVPDALAEGKQWSFVTQDGRNKTLTVDKIDNNEVLVKQINEDDPQSANAQITLEHEGAGFTLRSVSLTCQSHTLRIAFQPDLPLPSTASDTRDVTFTISQDGRAGIASGEVSVERALEAEYLRWKFNTPDWARNRTVQTGVNVITTPTSFGAALKQ